MMAFCAFLSLEAATIFIALVICWVDLTEAMRMRTSFKPGILLLFLCFVFSGNLSCCLFQGLYIFIQKFPFLKILKDFGMTNLHEMQKLDFKVCYTSCRNIF